LVECETNVKKSIQIYAKFKTNDDANNRVGCGLAYLNLACLYETKGMHKDAALEAKKSYDTLKEADATHLKAAKNALQLWESYQKKSN
jgi:hypothetical protein